MIKKELKPAVEAALFMSNDPLTVKDISKILKAHQDSVHEVLNEMKKEYESQEKGMYILETSIGYQMKVKPEYSSLVKTLTPYQDLSRGLLRVLALVAYKQPITQSEIVKVIGNRAYDYVKKLEQKGLIRTIKHGRTKALVATKEFANYFGLEKVEDLKKFFENLTTKESQNEGRTEQSGSNIPSE